MGRSQSDPSAESVIELYHGRRSPWVGFDGNGPFLSALSTHVNDALGVESSVQEAQEQLEQRCAFERTENRNHVAESIVCTEDQFVKTVQT